MPIRDKFPAEYFSTNPLDGTTPHEAYSRLQWGNRPRNTFKFEAPEPMAALGELAKLKTNNGEYNFREGKYFLAVGTRSNLVYFIPMCQDKRPLDFPKNFLKLAQPSSIVKRVDYYSEKGGESAYYYHDHEKPYPRLYIRNGHGYLLPAKHRGGRSYAVNDEGIIG